MKLSSPLLGRSSKVKTAVLSSGGVRGGAGGGRETKGLGKSLLKAVLDQFGSIDNGVPIGPFSWT